VDFHTQIGIYTLEKANRIVYVGKAGTAKKMSIWDRLYSHHYEKKDRCRPECGWNFRGAISAVTVTVHLIPTEATAINI